MTTTTFLATYDGLTYETDDPVFHDHISRGASEPYPVQLEVVKRYLRQFPHKARGYVDVGAHIGTTVLPYARLFAQVLALEPLRHSYDLLVKNIERNGATNCVALNVAAGAHTGYARSWQYSSANTGCVTTVASSPQPFYDDLACKVVRLDDVVPSGMSVDFVKMDVEGTELLAVLGASATLRRCSPLLQLETNGSGALHGIRAREVEACLAQLGYATYDCSDCSNTFYYRPDDGLCIEVPRVYACWTEDASMNQAREQCLRDLRATVGVELVLITPENLADHVLHAEPLHQAYPYLSATHRVDYLRMYLMHHYGGGYSDVKRTTASWVASFEELRASPGLQICGYPEIPGGVAVPGLEAWQEHLIGNCAYVARPRTLFTALWRARVHELLDERLSALRDFAATQPAGVPPDCCREVDPAYPIEWNEMLGRIFHQVNFYVAALPGAVSRSLPTSSFSDYR